MHVRTKGAREGGREGGSEKTKGRKTKTLVPQTKNVFGAAGQSPHAFINNTNKFKQMTACI